MSRRLAQVAVAAVQIVAPLTALAFAEETFFAGASFAQTSSASPSAPFHVPSPQIRTLENGLRVAVFPDRRLPLVQVQLLVRAGTAADPPDQAGAAHLTAELLRRGTSSRDPGDFEGAIGRLGGALAVSATRDYSTMEATFLARDLEAGLDLMSDAVMNPMLAGDELQQIKTRILAGIGQIRRTPANVAEEQLWQAVFGDHPYGRSPFGTAQSLNRLKVDEIRAFFRAHYRPDRATLAIAGDVTPERAFAVATDWFGRWAKPGTSETEPPFPPAPSDAGPRGLRIQLVDMPGATETALWLGLPAPRRGAADEAAFSYASALLGGAPSSRLARVVSRGPVRRGVASYHAALKEAGLWNLSSSAPNDSVRAVIDVLLAEVRRFQSEPPDETELAPLRRLARQGFAMQFETLGGLLNQWIIADLHGLPPDYLERNDERLSAVSASDVAAAARRWLDPERLVIVVAGPAAQIRPQVESLGRVEMADLEGPSARASERAAPGKAPTAKEEKRGREILKRAIAAHGGLSKLRRIGDSTVEADASLWVGDREIQGKIVQVRKEPYKMLFSTDFAGLGTKQTLNGNQAWSVSNQPDAGAVDMDSVGIAAMRSGFDADPPHLLLGAVALGVRIAGRGDERIGNQVAEAVDVGADAQHRVLYFDAKTHRLIAMDQHESSGEGAGFATRRTYGDFRPLNGIQWPHAEERFLDGKRVLQLRVTRVLLDSGVEDAMFERPEPPLPPPAR